MEYNEIVKTITGEVTARAWDKSGNPKKLFQPNKNWEYFKKKYNWDIKIPGLTGFYTYDCVFHNTITTKGKELIAQGMLDAALYMAIGTGTPSSTALGSEITTGGGERATATQSLVTTTTTNDTAQWVLTYVLSSPFTVTEEGLFNGEDPMASDMLTSWTMPGLSLVATDSLQLTHRIKVEQA